MYNTQVQYEYQLNSGYAMPSLGLGTSQIEEEKIEMLIRDAVEIGYRHFDCAFRYGNQPAIGRAFSKLFSEDLIQRKDIFVSSKIWCSCHLYEDALENVDTILKELQLDYLDLCLIHWPMSVQKGSHYEQKDEKGKFVHTDDDYLSAWRAMEDAYFADKIRSLGVSNFNRRQLDRILENCLIKPSNLQVECHPYLPQVEAIEYCKENDIIVTAYGSLGSPGILDRCTGKNLLHEPLVKSVADKYSKTPAQVLLNWALRMGTVVVPKTASSERLRENFDVWNFLLDDDDMKEMESLNCNLRMVTFKELQDHEYYPFHCDF